MTLNTRSSSTGLRFHRLPKNVLASSLVAVFACSLIASRIRAADDSTSPAEKQRQLISVLQSDAPPQEKAITCKKLLVCGTKDAVPALAALLTDKDLASWSRIALEAIPDPAAAAALRDALGKVEGRLLVGVINSIGARRDAQAVPALVEKLNNSDAQVASAAAAALGAIGGELAAKALEQSLRSSPPEVRSAVAEGGILCAEGFITGGKPAQAIKMYDAVRQATVPKQRTLEAIRGAILARQSAGLPLLLEQLRSDDKARFGIGLRTARELPGAEATQALASELDRTSSDRQAALVLVLAERNDANVLPAIRKAAGKGAKPVRMAAIGAIERLGDAASAPLLLEAATENDVELAETAKKALTRLPGEKIEADLLARLTKSEGAMRLVLIELAGERRIQAALPTVVRFTEDPDARVRSVAVETVGAIGRDNELAELVRILQKTQAPKERTEIEKALLTMSSRLGANCTPHLLPLMQNNDDAMRTVALHLFPTVGGPTALAAVKSALNDQTETVQDEAVRALSTWANNWPEDEGVAEPLLALAKSGKKGSHRVLGLRGYLQYIEEDKKLLNTDKITKVKEVIPLIKRPEEKRLAIALVGAIPTPEALELLVTYAAEREVAEEACVSIVNLAGGNALQGAAKDLRVKALQLVLEKSSRNTTKKRAEDALQKIK